MSSAYYFLLQKNKIQPCEYVNNSIHYEVMTGSESYGVSSNSSDIDVVGFCIPPKKIIFPHLNGEIPGFGKPGLRFEQFQNHHIKHDQKEYDITIFSIVKFFQLCMDNNPNMIDSLFVPVRCILSSTQIGNLVRENRKLFLHKGCWHKFKGYAYSQLHKIKTKIPDENSKRFGDIQKHGYDVKFAYHTVRLLNEVEQILIEHDLDLERNREQLKSIRRGDWKLEDIYDYFSKKESYLEKVYAESTLRYSPNESEIKELLLKCIGIHYNDLTNIVGVGDELLSRELKNIQESVERLKRYGIF